MTASNINSMISVVPINDFDEVVHWYKKLFGREADVLPMEGIAEWEVVENAWVQITVDPERAGSTTVIIGVNDVDRQRKACIDSDVSVSEILEYPGVIKMIEAADPDGNTISFVQDISNSFGA